MKEPMNTKEAAKKLGIKPNQVAKYYADAMEMFAMKIGKKETVVLRKKNIKVNAVLNMVKTISSIIFPLITFPYVSRVLMPENIGKVNFGSSFVSYFSYKR